MYIDMGKPQSIDTLKFFNTHGFSISFSHNINTDWSTQIESVGGAVTGSEPHQEDLGIRRDRLHTEASRDSDGTMGSVNAFCRDEADEDDVDLIL